MTGAEQKIEIVMWWCGDPVCDCTQPQINRWTRKPIGSWSCESLWEGDYRSQADSVEFTEQELELANARVLFAHTASV